MAAQVQQLTADIVLLDRILALYGPETASARNRCKQSGMALLSLEPSLENMEEPLIRGVAPQMRDQASLSNVRRRSRGSLPRLHLISVR